MLDDLTEIEIGDLKQAIENRTNSMLETMRTHGIKSVTLTDSAEQACDLIEKPNFYAVEQCGRDHVLVIEAEVDHASS